MNQFEKILIISHIICILIMGSMLHSPHYYKQKNLKQDTLIRKDAL